MEQDIPGKPSSSNWKDKLEDETAFASGELPDTNASWDKLYSRMRQPRRKKAIWYWVAASVFTLIMLSILFSQKPHIQNNSIVVSIPSNQMSKQARDENKNAPPDLLAPTYKKEKVKRTNKTNVEKVVVGPEQKEGQHIINNDVGIAETPAPPAAIATKPISDTVSSAQLVSSQTRAKLKVVHVNELGNTNNANSKRYESDYGAIHFGITSQQLYNKTPLPSAKIGLNISTNKTSPVN